MEFFTLNNSGKNTKSLVKTNNCIMETPRNNVRPALRVPNFANVTIYALGIHLSVTFHIKKDVMQYLELPSNANPSIFCYDKFGKSYISETQFIYWDDITQSNDLDKTIISRATEMKKRLMIMHRKAKIAYLNNEINLINLA